MLNNRFYSNSEKEISNNKNIFASDSESLLSFDSGLGEENSNSSVKRKLIPQIQSPKTDTVSVSSLDSGYACSIVSEESHASELKTG